MLNYHIKISKRRHGIAVRAVVSQSMTLSDWIPGYEIGSFLLKPQINLEKWFVTTSSIRTVGFVKGWSRL